MFRNLRVRSLFLGFIFCCCRWSIVSFCWYIVEVKGYIGGSWVSGYISFFIVLVVIFFWMVLLIFCIVWSIVGEEGEGLYGLGI